MAFTRVGTAGTLVWYALCAAGIVLAWPVWIVPPVLAAVAVAALGGGRGARVTAVVGRTDRAGGLRELGACEVVEGIDKAAGRFGLILESAGGASLSHAIRLIEPKGTVVVYGNSSNEPTTLAFADFRPAPNARVQSFSYFYSEAEDRFAPDLGLLVSLIADGSLEPRIGVERSWRDFAAVAEQLRDRRVAGKAVLLVD